MELLTIAVKDDTRDAAYSLACSDYVNNRKPYLCVYPKYRKNYSIQYIDLNEGIRDSVKHRTVVYLRRGNNERL